MVPISDAKRVGSLFRIGNLFLNLADVTQKIEMHQMELEKLRELKAATLFELKENGIIIDDSIPAVVESGNEYIDKDCASVEFDNRIKFPVLNTAVEYLEDRLIEATEKLRSSD